MPSESSHRSSCLLGPLLLAGLLLFAGLASLCGQHCSSRTAAEADWERAAAAAVEAAEAGDGIRVHPSWTETPLPHLQPVGNLLHRQHFPILEDIKGIDRFVILTETRSREEALERLPFDATVDELQSFGTVELVIIHVPDALQITSDLTDYLGDATVAYRDTSGHAQACQFRRGEWHCDGRSAANRVRPILLEVEHEARRCIQAYPPSEDRYLSVAMTIDELDDVLRIRAGLDNRAARIANSEDVEYRIFVDDEPIADERVDAHTSTWSHHDIPTDSAGNRAVELRIEVESVSASPRHRRFCFNGWTLSAEQAQKSKR